MLRTLLSLAVVVLVAFSLPAARSSDRTPPDAGAAPDGLGGQVRPEGVAARLLACDQVVPVTQAEVDQAAPGEVICLAAGRRGALRLTGLQGTASRPITVVNHGGVVEIDAPGAYAGLELRDVAHVHVTGTGTTGRCGAHFGEDEQRCGIRVTGSFNGIAGKTRTTNLTVDHVEVGDVESAGLGTHDKELDRDEWLQRDVAFRDLYVHDIGTEGHYHGSSDYTSGDQHLLDGVEITRNLVVRTGRDGIQVGSAPRNCRIAQNVVRDTGRNGESKHEFGIIVNRGSSCDVIGNRVERSPRSGIYDQGLHGQVIARNTVLDSGELGIQVTEGDQAADDPQTPDFPRSTHVVDNRIQGAAGGIRLGNTAGTDNRVTGNRLADVSGAAVELDDGVRAEVGDNREQ
ncbi:right-handed parallel beta-helix repeat-containing protein [Egicoccus sp. AB-alg2]|uniref:right-handed parallel beta-helix repeat-containing protein n=1 Tax=Egicoccus sp. AB-alg2 TaxID=3242693 RepID=UPI00359DE0AE